MGRPLKEINEEQFEGLCNLQCTLEEIAGFFKCSSDTIERWCERTYETNFAEVYKKHSQNGKISLRRLQFKLAERNPSMAIWLGKQYLNQRDRISNIVETDEESKELLKAYMEGVKLGESKENTES